MTTRLPRIVVAAPATGQGKTTVSTGLMAALTRAGHVVSGHKVGPDYIDPGYHALACGRPGRNLDPHLVGEHRVAPLLLHGARTPVPADVAVVEGVMGLFDGRVGGKGFSSTAHVAALTRTPVVLVVDISRSSRSIGAVVHGMATYDDSVEVVGVLLNKAGSPRHAAEVTSSISLPVLGTIPRDPAVAAPSRHLGLVPAEERELSAAALDALADHVAASVDLDAVLAVARSAPDLDVAPWSPHDHVAPPADVRHGARPVVAVAGGRAFTFRYAETEELLRAAGCDVVAFDPLADAALPTGTAAVYLGGGFPEVHAADLTGNATMRASLRAAVAAGVPTVAECAGLLYLCDTLDGEPMVGAVAAGAAMTERLTLRYPAATAPADSLLGRAGEEVTGHEFHRTHVDPVAGDVAAWTVDGTDVGTATPTLHASYLHTHWAGHPQLAQRFADAAHAYAAPVVEERAPAPTVEEPAPAPTVEERAPAPEVEEPAPAPTVEERAPASVTRPPDPVVEERAPAPEVEERAPAPAVEERAPASVTRPPDPVVEERAPASVTRPPDPVVEERAPASVTRPPDPLRHHGDAETGDGLVDLAVNVHPGPPPGWLTQALVASLDEVGSYPDPTAAERAVADHHGRAPGEVLATAGAAEAFGLLARLRPWRRPVVVHPQFTEPHAALEQSGHEVTSVLCRAEDDFVLDPAAVPEDADLVVVGNPTNPTGVLHPAAALRGLVRPGRLVVVDEAFMDAVPGEPESLAGGPLEGLVVLRSLTKHWSVPGVRAGYLLAAPDVAADLRRGQTPWSVSTTAAAALQACCAPAARAEAGRRALELTAWREHLAAGLTDLGVEVVGSSTSFVLARLGEGVREALREAGVAVRRGDTFPGLDASWCRVAAREPATTEVLLAALAGVRGRGSSGALQRVR
ncbi:cobyrinate a,c-diamide synthase [Nocardioides sp. AX2bis]|uniref:cobyrinate a,c-diamide synthase n=1 Tax=Nocardioides sp. AX2bis TaxID=2653157 RepID=UPI0012F1738B|nr:cobyrinate a,c-diamide synthase [Nocardioides sp. AX2bis]VXC50631.1 Hydrogenobyrinate a,c-diamide synthase [Nocardioides sp. AX2bis]